MRWRDRRKNLSQQRQSNLTAINAGRTAKLTALSAFFLEKRWEKEIRKMTIEEIANELGVSKSTVSRALSGKGRIGKATIERIQAYVAAQDNLSNQYGEKKANDEKKLVKTGNIGVVIPADAYTDSIPFFQECLLGISEAAASENYNVIITTGTATDYSGAKQLVEDHKVDGMILMRSYDEDLTLEYLIKQGIARAYIEVDGRDITIWFGKENDIIISAQGYVNGEKGYETIELLEDSVLYKMNLKQ